MQWLLESAFCLACFYSLYWLLLRHETFFQWNRAYLLITPVLSLLLPACYISVTTPAPTHAPLEQAVDQSVVPEIAPVLMVTRQAPEALEHGLSQPLMQSLTIGEIGVWAYGLVALLLGFLLFRRIWKLARLIRNSKLEQHEDFVLAEVPEEGTPAASFFSIIFWKRGQLTENEQFILAHEMVHVRQRHSLDVLFMEIMVLLQWFNPLVWMCRRSLQAVHEFIADDYVVRESRQRLAYATLLARQQAAYPKTQLFNTFHSQLKIRLFMLSKRPSHWLRQGKYLFAVPLVSALMLLFSFRLIENMPAAAPLRNVLTEAEHFVEKIAAVPLISSEKTAPIEPTPYILYWGVLQARINQVESTGDYFAEIHTSLEEFKEALKREPRLWDGQALAPNCSLKMGDILVKSDYYNENTYAEIRPQLLETAAQLTDSSIVKISEIALPNGKTGEVFVFFNQAMPKWLKPSQQVNYKSRSFEATSAYSLLWGKERFDRKAREFFTVDEFWNIVNSEPILQFEDGRSARPQEWNVNIRLKSGEVNRIPDYPDKDKMSVPDLQVWLNSQTDEIQPGASLYFFTWDSTVQTVDQGIDSFFSIVTNYMPGTPQTYARLNNGAIIQADLLHQIQVAAMRIVPDEDPRLTLRLSDQKDFDFTWGSYTYTLFDVYTQAFQQPDGAWTRAQTDITTSNNNFSRTQILDLLRLPAKMKDDSGQPLAPLSFTLKYNDYTAQVTNGICPPDFILLMEKELQPYQKLVISDIHAGEMDLGFLEIIFEVRNEDPKALLRPSYAPVNAPAEQQVRLFPIPSKPLQGKLNLSFALPAKGKATFVVTDPSGKALWTSSGLFVKGTNQLAIPVAEIDADGFMVLTLEASGVKVQQQFVILK